MKTNILTALYFLISFVYIFIPFNPEILPDIILKALIIPVLIVILFVNTGKELNRLHVIMFAGLILSWAGDITLEFTANNGNMFIMGLLFFLLAHLMYLAVFISTPGNNSIFSKRVSLVIPVLFFGTALVAFLYNDLGEMKIPVILYAIVILLMLTGAINRIEKVNRKSYWLVLAGAILFVISDSTIAINKFSSPFEGSSIVIMITYIIAQFLIIQGYIYQYRKV
jgi:uncharacterized membrane protein YhhN